jgi:hypothetical protein
MRGSRQRRAGTPDTKGRYTRYEGQVYERQQAAEGQVYTKGRYTKGRYIRRAGISEAAGTSIYEQAF